MFEFRWMAVRNSPAQYWIVVSSFAYFGSRFACLVRHIGWQAFVIEPFDLSSEIKSFWITLVRWIRFRARLRLVTVGVGDADLRVGRQRPARSAHLHLAVRTCRTAIAASVAALSYQNVTYRVSMAWCVSMPSGWCAARKRVCWASHDHDANTPREHQLGRRFVR